MAATAAGVSLSTTAVVSKAESPKNQALKFLHGTSLLPLRARAGYRAGRVTHVRPVASTPPTPPGISEKVAQSIKEAEEACAGDPKSSECAALWDEVEELSAAASHARDKLKENSDPLEAYCKENPETEECRTYED